MNMPAFEPGGPSCALSVVVPVYNEDSVLVAFHHRIVDALAAVNLDHEVIYVDDGSDDRSAQILKQLHVVDPRVGVLRFSRNFGKEIAMTAGLRLAHGEAVVVIDADLQDPPELIARMVEAWREGADVVNMRRRSREGETWLKKATAHAFYRVINRLSEVPIPEDVGDFRLLSRRAVDALNLLDERNRFMKGLFAWVGYRQTTIEYDRQPRAAGCTKWRYRKLWNLALEGLTAFSVAPLKIASHVGMLSSLASFAYGVYFLVKAWLFGDPVQGFPTLIVAMLFLGGLQLMAIGIVGEYLGRLCIESKRRPLYLIEEYAPAGQAAHSTRGAAQRARRMSARVSRSTRTLLALLVALALLRLASLAFMPLMDTTEARYAEIGRKMAEFGDWVTPRYTMGEPFWGKPPLSFWLTAASFKLLDVNEFAARLPHYLCALLVGFLVWRAAAQRSRREAMLAVALLAGSTLFFVSAGAVMTDMALVVGTTLAMHGFWSSARGTIDSRRLDRWLPFIGLAVGLLAKGPIALVLIGAPLLLWTFWSATGASVLQRPPWAGGAALLLVVVVPWYALAELKTPGFLDYFLVGEHWHRYVTPGWAGDLYGNAHRVAPGTIWWFAFIALLPWSVLLPVAAWWWRRDATTTTGNADRQWQRYLLIWAAMPLLLFTPARNLIWTYVLPAIPALSLWMAAWLARHARPARIDALVSAGLAMGLFGVIAYAVDLERSGRGERKSAKAVVAAYDARRMPGQPLIFVGLPSHSAAFYSRGTAQQVRDAAEVARLLHGGAFVAVRTDAGGNWPPDRLDIGTVGRFGGYDLLVIEPGGMSGKRPRDGRRSGRPNSERMECAKRSAQPRQVSAKRQYARYLRRGRPRLADVSSIGVQRQQRPHRDTSAGRVRGADG